MVDDAVEEAGDGEHPANDRTDLRQERREGLALLGHDDLHRREVVREDGRGQARAVLVVVVVHRVLVRVEELAARELIRRVHHLEVVLERRVLDEGEVGGVGEHREAVGHLLRQQPSLRGAEHPPERHVAHGVGHVQAPRLERVRARMGRNVEVPRDAVHEDDASHRAPLAVPAHLRVAFAQRLARVGVVDVLKDELLEGLVRAVANVLLARVRVVPPVDLDRRESVHVLRLAQVLALLPRAVHLSEGDVVALGRLHNLVEGLLPHRREAPAPRAPRRVEVDHHQLLGGDRRHEVLLGQLRRNLRHVLRSSPRLGVHELLRVLCRAPQDAPVAVDARLDDVRRHVLEVGAHDIGDIEAGVPARERVQRHIEIDLQLRLEALVEHNGRLRVHAHVRAEAARLARSTEARRPPGGRGRGGQRGRVEWRARTW